MTMAAAALVVAAAASSTIGVEALRPAGIASIQLAIVFAFMGGAALYLTRARPAWLPDRSDSQASAGSGLDGWMIVFPLTLSGMPLLFLVQLRPLAEFWADVFALAAELNLLEELQRSSGMSGIVLMPVIVALAVPGIDAVAAATQLVGSALLLLSLLVRSSRVPRALVLCALIQGGLVAASIIGTTVVERLAPSIEQLIRETPDSGGTEQGRALEELQRYRVVTGGASQTLTAAWILLAVWTPILLLNARARATFAAVEPSPGEAGTFPSIDPKQVTNLTERARARVYVDAAKQIDEATPPSRWF